MKYKNKPSLYGAIIGDIVGSIYEGTPIRSKDFDLFTQNNNFNEKGEQTVASFYGSHFTDDTVMTLAIANALLECNGDYRNLRQMAVKNMQELGHKYPHAGYGRRFKSWLNEKDPEPYYSFGNGSAMRISAVPYFANSLTEVIGLSKMVTDVTHNHYEGEKGAEALAVAIWLAQNNYSKEEIKKYIEDNYYKLDFDYDELILTYGFDETCPGSMAESLFAFFISDSYEDCIKTAVSMGGDADTMACIAGALAGAYYGVPQDLVEKAKCFITPDLQQIIDKFDAKIQERN